MFDLTGRRLWAYAQAADLRKGHEGLRETAHKELARSGCRLEDGDVVLFVNGTRTRCKVLMKEYPENPSSPWLILYKRSDRAIFPAVWSQSKTLGMELSMRELRSIMGGAEMVRRATPIRLAPAAKAKKAA